MNQVKSPRSCEKVRTSSQVKFEESRDRIREIAQETFDHVALFSNGPSKPVTIAVPSSNAWEGINIDRSNLNQPGLQVVDKGKVYGNSQGFFLIQDPLQRLLMSGDRYVFKIVCNGAYFLNAFMELAAH